MRWNNILTYISVPLLSFYSQYFFLKTMYHYRENLKKKKEKEKRISSPLRTLKQLKLYYYHSSTTNIAKKDIFELHRSSDINIPLLVDFELWSLLLYVVDDMVCYYFSGENVTFLISRTYDNIIQQAKIKTFDTCSRSDTRDEWLAYLFP